MRVLLGLILLAFPVAELWLLVELGQRYGWWLLFYLLGIGFLGFQLISEEKAMLSGRMMEQLRGGGSPIKTMFGSLRNMIAGIFLIIPGVITDIIAVALLLIPIRNHTLPENGGTTFDHSSSQAANDDVIEGEFRRED
ncbi:MAG: FxsA family protein [Betaproteobacteria bacterium]|nr:FxsA family protein [Betaproteobacteria bacterium]